MENDLLIFDFEVFIKDWMVVIKNYRTRETTNIINNSTELSEFYEKNKESIWIGYNNRNYDQFILKGLLLGMNPYDVSCRLINEKEKGYSIIKNHKDIQLYNFDLSNKFRGLKELEGFMGSKIKESDVEFTIQRKLTNEELDEVLTYCQHDVNETEKVFNNLKHELDSQTLMIDAFGLDMEMFDKTKAQLSAFVLGAEKPKGFRVDDFDLSFPDTLKLEKYKHVFEWYCDIKNRNYKKSLFTDISGVPHVFAWGGIHGAIPSYVGDGKFIMSDIASMYPALMIEYDYLSRNVKDKYKYREIRDRRLELKKIKDPTQAPLKIVLNSTYGAMKDNYNDLIDPLMANNVCIGGQLLLLDLIEKVEPYCKLIQSNTDGILVKVESEEDEKKYMEVCEEWCKRSRLDLEHDVYVKVIQKDVNNYIIVDETGDYKSKGAYVKKLNKIDYNLPILNKALIDYFIKDVPIEETILACDEMIEFQQIVKITSNYNKAIHNDKEIREKVIRVFASSDESDGMIYKIKGDDKYEKIQDTPENCFICNDEVSNMRTIDKLDKFHYITVAHERVEKFLHNDGNKEKSGIKNIKIDTIKKIQSIIEEFDDFLEFYNHCLENNISKKEILNLTRLNYFEKFASIGKILDMLELFDIYKNKTFSADKINDEHLMYFEMYSEKSKNGKTYKNIDKLEIFKLIFENLEDRLIDSKEFVRYQMELLGYVEDIPNDLSVGRVLSKSSKHRSIQVLSLRNNTIRWFKIPKELPLCEVDDFIIIEHYKKKKGYNRDDWWIEKYEILK